MTHHDWAGSGVVAETSCAAAAAPRGSEYLGQEGKWEVTSRACHNEKDRGMGTIGLDAVAARALESTVQARRGAPVLGIFSTGMWPFALTMFQNPTIINRSQVSSPADLCRMHQPPSAKASSCHP